MKAINHSIAAQTDVSLSYLFLTFLRVGASAYGGHMGLLSVVEKLMVERDKVLDHQKFLDGISIASMLPGPMAVNVVAYIGYKLRGASGLLISMLGVLLPACLLMFVLAWAYFQFAFVFQIKTIFVYIIGAISAIILSSGFNLAKKELRGNTLRAIFALVAFLLLLWVSHYAITIILMASGAFLGIVLQFTRSSSDTSDTIATIASPVSFNFSLSIISKWLLGIFLIVELLYITNAQQFMGDIYLRLTTVVAGTSLTLFGGGYVMVPIMQSLYVNELGWLTNQEFIDVIAFSQITPGPILVSATFIGYKLAGVLGGLLATISIFLPSALLMVIASRLILNNQRHPLVCSALEGIRAVVVGMILASGITILTATGPEYKSVFIALLAFVLIQWGRVNPLYIILGALITGLVIENFIPVNSL